MVDSMLFGRAVEVMRQSLNISSERNQLISGNIANVDTVGYAPTDLDFKQSLLRAMDASDEDNLDRTHARHLSGGNGDTFGRSLVRNSSDEAVDIDQEMTNLAENNIQYRTSSEMLVRKINLIKYSITEGGK
jgi:flagellar basal-body rod protein FlgB